jgi:hypothetical protein
VPASGSPGRVDRFHETDRQTGIRCPADQFPALAARIPCPDEKIRQPGQGIHRKGLEMRRE